MKFECGDLERALTISELMPEAREHLKHCAACRREYRLWNEISTTAKELHETWDTPDLWPNIRKALQAEPRSQTGPAWWRDWKTWSLAAAGIALAAGLFWFQPWTYIYKPPGTAATPALAPTTSADQDFLTEQALQEVEKTEAAYRQSIDKLSRLAQPRLNSGTSAAAVNYRERLVMLDSAITETRANLDHNRFNVHLQNVLADLYRQKQHTLEELLTRAQTN